MLDHVHDELGRGRGRARTSEAEYKPSPRHVHGVSPYAVYLKYVVAALPSGRGAG